MKKNFKRLTGICTVVCMLASMLTLLPVSAAIPVSQIYADFDGYSDVDTFAADYYIFQSVKYRDEWQSVNEIASTTDIRGNETDALHVYWDKPETITSESNGNDALFGLNDTDYSGDAVTSFDIKLDNDVSAFRAYDRLRLTKDGSTSTTALNLVAGSANSVSVLGQSIDEAMEPGEWYHFTVATSYDEASSTVTSSMWMNGVKKASNITLTYDGTLQIDATTSQNRLLFQSTYSTNASDDKKPGVWIDNIMFSQIGDGYCVTNPENGAFYDGNTVEYTFAADIDASTIDAGDIKVYKNNAETSAVSAEVFCNKITVVISTEELPLNSSYTVVLPEGTKDILGNEISEESRTLSFLTAEAFSGEVEITSPASGSIIEYGKPVKLYASAAANAELSFCIDGEVISTVKADENGVASYEWTPDAYGTKYITAESGGAVSRPAAIDVYQITDLNVSWSAGNGTSESVESYEGYSDVTKLTSNSGTKGYLNKSGLAMTEGIAVINMDVYVGADGNGALLTSRGTDAAGVTTSFNRIVNLSGGGVYIGNEDYQPDGASYITGAWNNVRAVVDVASKSFDVYLNGRQIANDYAFAVDMATFNQVRIQNPSNGSVAYYANAAIGILTENVVVYSAHLDSTLDGASIEKNQPVVLKMTAEGGEAEAAEVYVNGAKAGDAAAAEDGSYIFEWTPAASGDAEIYALVSIDSEMYKTEEISVKVLTDATSTDSVRAITVQDGTVSDEDAADTSTAITIGSRNGSGNQPYTAVGNTKTTTGYVSAECDITFSDGAGLLLSNRNSGTNYTQKAVELTGGKIYYYNGTTAVDSGLTYTAGTAYNIRTLWNLQELTVDIYINGELMPFKTTFREDWSNINSIRYTASSTKGQEFVIQNECVRIIPVAPELENVSVVDSAGNAIAAVALKAENIASINVVYNMAIDEESLTAENFVLFRGSGNDAVIPVSLSLSEDAKTVIITPDAAAMDDASLYRLEISADVTSAGVACGTDESYSFRTVAVGRGVINALFTNGGETLTSIASLAAGDKITFSAEVIDNKAEDIWLVAAVYSSAEDGKKVLKDVAVVKTHINDVTQAHTYTAELEITKATESGDTLCGYVWTEEMIPFGDEYALPYQN